MVRAYQFGQDSFSFHCSGVFILATLAKKIAARNRMFIWGGEITRSGWQRSLGKIVKTLKG
jgi:hypothetical protein